MKNEYSFEHFQKRRKHIREKNKRTKRRLLVLFLTTFSTVLMLFLVVANLITPEIDIPALNNDYDSMSDVRSSDFKKRIDARLTQIKVDDDSPTRIVEKPDKNKDKPKKEEAKKKESEQDIIKNFFANAEKIKDDIIRLDFSNAEESEAPVPNADANEPSESLFGGNTNEQLSEGEPEVDAEPKPEPKPVAPPKPVAVAPKPPVPPAPYAPIQTVKPVKAKKYKVLVGQFSSPEEARRLSENIAKSSGVKPFIKNHNGRYCVQVGSYGDSQKARGVAGRYSGYGARVVND